MPCQFWGAVPIRVLSVASLSVQWHTGNSHHITLGIDTYQSTVTMPRSGSNSGVSLQRGPRCGSHNNILGRKSCPRRSRGKRPLTLEEKQHIYCTEIRDRFYPDRNRSTISNVYNPKNRRKYERLLAKGVSKFETVMSPNRTDNIRDMEQILNLFTQQDTLKSIFLTKGMIKHNALLIFDYLWKTRPLWWRW